MGEPGANTRSVGPAATDEQVDTRRAVLPVPSDSMTAAQTRSADNDNIQRKRHDYRPFRYCQKAVSNDAAKQIGVRYNMNTYPLAVISPLLGARSETFIHRHMMQLLPGKTVVAVQRVESGLADIDIQFPCILIGGIRKGWLNWFDRGRRFFLRLAKQYPIILQTTLEHYLKEHGVRVVLSEYLDQSLKWLDVASKLGIRFYAHAHGYDISASLRDPDMRRKYLRLETADGIITMSEVSRQRLIALGLSGEKIHVIPYGINVPNMPLMREQRETIQCLAVGRMVAKKAPLLTLQAFRQALLDFPRLRLDYVGGGELFNDAQRYVHDHDLGDRITLHGAQPNTFVQEMMKQADIFVQHSRTDPQTGDEEGLPVGILEAMAAALPVVSTRHAGIPEAVIEGETGFLVNEGDVDGMARCLVRLAEDAGLRSQFGHAGWQRARHRFTWDQERTALLELLGLKDLANDSDVTGTR